MQFELHYNSQCCTNALQCIALQFTIEGKCSGMPLIAGQRGINRFHTRHSATSYSSSSPIIISTIYNLICILIIIQTLLNQNCDHQPNCPSAFSAAASIGLLHRDPPSSLESHHHHRYHHHHHYHYHHRYHHRYHHHHHLQLDHLCWLNRLVTHTLSPSLESQCCPTSLLQTNSNLLNRPHL